MATWTDLTDRAFKAVLSSSFINQLLDNVRWLRENGTVRSALAGAAVASSAGGSTVTEATATVDTGFNGSKTVTLTLAVTGVAVAAGANNVGVATVVTGLRPGSVVPLVAAAGTIAVTANVTTSGSVAIRWTSGAIGSGLEIRISGSYSVPIP